MHVYIYIYIHIYFMMLADEAIYTDVVYIYTVILGGKTFIKSIYMRP